MMTQIPNDDSNPDTTGLTWTINSLSGSGSTTLEFDATVDTGARALNPITNNASLADVDQTEDNTSNNIGSAIINVVGLDISVTKAVSNATPTEGDTVTYTVTVENLSSQNATNVAISDALPGGVTYVAASAAGPGATYTAGTNTVSWSIAALNASTSIDLTFEATVDAGASAFNPITNSASITSVDQSEEDNGNNTGSVDINVQTFDVSVAKAVSNAAPEEGETITYTITVSNVTPTVAGTNIEITDIVPAGVTY